MNPETGYWETAHRVCTTKEYESLELHYRRGLSYRKIALALGVTHPIIFDRIQTASRKIAAALDQEPAA